MTDNEIIKALECMTGISCNDCHYSHEDCGDRIKDVEELSKYALDLINRQQEDIERLQSMNRAKLDTIHDLQADTNKLKEQLQNVTEKFNCQQTVYADLSKIIKNQKEEIVRLEYENEILSKNADTAFQDGLNEAQDLYAEQIKDEIKSEAIKELIDKLEPDHTFEIQRDDGYWEKVVRLESIKAIAKELVGED